MQIELQVVSVSLKPTEVSETEKLKLKPFFHSVALYIHIYVYLWPV